MKQSVINSDRLEISLFDKGDAASFFKLTQDDGFNAYPITIYRQKDEASARDWLRETQNLYAKTGNLGKYAVRLAGNEDIIGMGGLTPWNLEGEQLVDITYRLHSSIWGKGLGLELAELLKRRGQQQLKLQNLTATITPDNVPSKKIAEKIGLKYERSILLLGVPTDLYRLDKNN